MKRAVEVMSPNTIAHVITGLGTGGAEMMLLRLLTLTDREQWRPIVISLRDRGPIGERIAGLDVPVISLQMRGPLHAATGLWRLRAALRAAAPAIVQGWMYHGNLAGWIGRAVTRRQVPLLWNIRYTPAGLELEKRGTAAAIRWGARLSSRPALIIYNSLASAARHAQLGYAPTRTQVIPNGLDAAQFAPSPAARAAWRTRIGATAQTVVIGRVGRYHPMKDYPTFLRAVALLPSGPDATRFVLAGEGVHDTNEALTTLIRELGIGDRVRLLGDVCDVHELNAALDIACSSSAYGEAFPTVVAEAMACGVPCVATDVGDSAWVLGGTGIVVRPGEPDALAAACQKLIDAGPEERRRMGTAARERVLQAFTLRAAAAKYDDVYQSVLNDRTETV